MRSSPTTPDEIDAQREQEMRAAMMRRLGIVEDTPPEPAAPVAEPAPAPAAPRLKVVTLADEFDIPSPQESEAPAPMREAAPASYEQQLDDILSRFGIDDRPAAKARRAEPAPEPEPEAYAEEELATDGEDFDDLAPVWQPPVQEAPPVREPAPVLARKAEFDIPAQPLRAPEPEPEVEREPQPVSRRAPLQRPAPEADAAPRAKQTQEEMLQELRRQFKGSHMSQPARREMLGLPVESISIPLPTKAQKRRLMGEMAYTRLVIWVLAIIASGLMTYNVVKASVEHDRAEAKSALVRTIEQAEANRR